jgi:uncharacterized protein
MNPDLPLSEEELNELEQFLLIDSMPDDCMNIAMLDGFLVGLSIGPETLSPSQWLPVIWGETDDQPMNWESLTQMQHIISLVMRMYNDRVHDLQEGIDDFEPLLYMDKQDGQSRPILDDWCLGFVLAIQLDPEGWEPLIAAEPEAEGGGLLTPMLLYGTEEGWAQLQENLDLKAHHQEFADAIGPCVIGIRDYWLPHRKAAATYRRESAKVGRNDLCPCGSGKKFKKCCGSTEKLH